MSDILDKINEASAGVGEAYIHELEAELERTRAERDEYRREWESACERLRADPHAAKDWQERATEMEARLRDVERERDCWRTACASDSAKMFEAMADRDAALARVAELEKEVAASEIAVEDFEEERDAARTESERLKALALRIAKVHDMRCSSLVENHPDIPPYRCDCARDEVLAEIARPSVPEPERETDRIYPCDRCDKLRTKAEGGTVFTVCEECWDETMPKDPDPGSRGETT